MAKSDAVKGLAGVVDALVGAAGNAVDDARRLVDEADKYVTKGAVILTNLVDALEGLSTDEPVDNGNRQSPSREYIFTELLKKGFQPQYLETLNINRLINMYNTVVKGTYENPKPDDVWANETDEVKQTGPVDKTDRDVQVEYILSRPSAWYTRQMLATLTDEEVTALYDHYRQVYRNRD